MSNDVTKKMPDYRRFSQTVVGVVSAFIILLIAFSVWKSVVEYRLTIRAAEQLSRGYARALKEHAERAFSEADSVLYDTIEHVKLRGGIEKETSQDLRRFLQRNPQRPPQIASIVLVDSQGRLFAHSLDTPVKQADVSDRDYFIYHRDHPADTAAYISKPFKSRINGKWRFTISRVVHSERGEFSGLVAAALEMEYFQEFYASLDLGTKGKIVMLRRDGALLLAQPFRESDYAKDFSKSHLIRTYLPRAPKGTFHIAPGKALLEKEGRIISYDSLDHYPVLANANMGTDEVLAPWRKNAATQAGLTLIVIVALVLLLLLLRRQIGRIEEGQRRQLVQKAELRLEKERYRLLVDNLPVVTWQSDRDGNTTFINRSVEQIYGYSPAEIVAGGPALWFGRIHPEDLSAVQEAFEALFDTGRIYDVRYRIQRKDGQWIWLHDFAYATRVQDGVRIAHGVFSDITAHRQAEHERELLEEQLRQAQKMEAIGHLAGGIAHDFNNLLTPILGYAEMVACRLPSGDPLTSKIAGITAAAHKAKDLTHQLLSFGRRQPVAATVVDLNEIIESFHIVLRRTIRESIAIRLTLDPAGAYVNADRSQMEQIILNMTVNAQDALGGRGSIAIETCCVRMEGENARLHPGMVEGDYVLLAFRDDGCGIAADVLPHIFEPFFTTKPAGHGTGLGLATVYGIVKQHEGFISVTSREQEGTSFQIYLPACAQVPLLKVAEAVAERPAVNGTATILVVEDNEMVREMVRDMLAGYGYTVLTAADAGHAIGVVEQNRERIDLLVSDVVMPVMSGPELYEQLAVQLPDLKVVFISGYPMNPSIRGGTLQEGVSYLQKPFTAEALLERVRMVL